MNIVTKVIERLAGPERGRRARAAERIGVSVKTLEAWERRGRIPAKQQARLLQVPTLDGVPLAADELIAPSPVIPGPPLPASAHRHQQAAE